MLATATLAATVMLRSPPASAANQCPKKRTIVVGKGETQVLAKKQCKHKFIKKGLEAFGQAYVIVGKLMSCEEIGNPKGGNDYWQCICSAYICKHIPLDPGAIPISIGSQKNSIAIPEFCAYRTVRLARAEQRRHRSDCRAWAQSFDERGSQPLYLAQRRQYGAAKRRGGG
jgi:hypothetical protein